MSLAVQEEGKEPGAPVVDAKKAAKEKRMAEQLAKAQKGSQVHTYIYIYNLGIYKSVSIYLCIMGFWAGRHKGLVDLAWLCPRSEVAGACQPMRVCASARRLV